jgi:hypothetical protein
MSGYQTRTVKYNDPYDCGKMDSTEESYYAQYHGTSDVITFVREGKEIVGLSKGDAWLFMKALEDIFQNEEPYLFKQFNPFTRE